MIARVMIAVLVSGCAGQDTSGDDDEVINCDVETRADEFVAGIEKTGASMTFRLLSATPAPPARGDNTWQIEIVDPAGPVPGATFRVTPFMPDHQHGSPIEVLSEPLPQPGQYQLAPINMWMPAFWETTIEATANGTTDKVVFKFCVPS